MSNKDIIKKYIRTKPLLKRKYFCYAPLTNLYFGQNGDVTPCCQNRTPIGRYPEQTIREIWDGEKAHELQHKMKIRDLSAGCFMCEKHLNSLFFKDLKPSQYDHLTVKRGYPTMMEFALSNKCNFECIMCRPLYSSSWAKTKNADIHLVDYNGAFVDQLDEFIPYLKETRFFGGEPLLIDVYYEIWERIIQKNPRCNIIVQTNAGSLPDKFKLLLEKGRFSFSISIDSLQKETYETIRNNASFEKTMKNINFFSDYCKRKKTFFGIAVCPLKVNWKEMPDFVDFCQKKNATLFFNIVNWPLKLSVKKSSSEELYNIYEHLKSVKFTEGNSIHSKNVKYYKSYLLLIKGWEKDAIERESGKDANIEIVNIEIGEKIDRAFSIKNFSEDKEMVKQKIIQAVESLKDEIDFTDLLSNLLRSPDIQFVELIKNKSLEELGEMAQEYTI